MNDITRKDVIKAFILAVPVTAVGLAFFGGIGFMLHIIFGG